LKMRKYSMEH